MMYQNCVFKRQNVLKKMTIDERINLTNLAICPLFSLSLDRPITFPIYCKYCYKPTLDEIEELASQKPADVESVAEADKLTLDEIEELASQKLLKVSSADVESVAEAETVQTKDILHLISHFTTSD